ncbi:GntR family transcriptional regulator [Nesterenkonia lutea]|uniref:DNA-binding GntR family transcriptional regulator n=1 Tax=Nesterenkonia lutea TaxID=272919 RepID=A0ABR9JG61_9MICC|nr:GntR family transcriptional regulator [Nesterenkonia lutea]MBE1524915.1 DNA-binding GntR family transcriptional regulator [Nesterenkonia lutea]
MQTEIESQGQAPPLAERAYRVLRDRLIMLDLPPGSPLSESQLSAELGLGRTPLREALKRLETDHLVVSYPRRGTFATIVDITELAAISEVRLLLEPAAAGRAARMLTPALRGELEHTAAAVEAIDETRAPRELIEYDLEVHRLIYRAAGNHHLEASLVRLDNLATRIWCLVLDRLPPIAEHIAGHGALLRAILDGDDAAAQKLARDHVRDFEVTVREAL